MNAVLWMDGYRAHCNSFCPENLKDFTRRATSVVVLQLCTYARTSSSKPPIRKLRETSMSFATFRTARICLLMQLAGRIRGFAESEILGIQQQVPATLETTRWKLPQFAQES